MLVLVLVALVGGAGCGLVGSRRTQPVALAEIDGVVAGGVTADDGSLVLVVTRSDDGAAETSLVRLDPSTGDEVERSVLAPVAALDGVARVDGSLLVRLRGRMADAPAVEQQWYPNSLVSGELWAVLVETATFEVAQQYQLPPMDDGVNDPFGGDEPLVVIDGVFWFLGTGDGRGRIDLRTGELLAVHMEAFPGIRSVAQWGSELVVVRREVVRIYDLATGTEDASYQYADWPFNGLAPGTGLRFHDGGLWVEGRGRDDWNVAYRYDPETEQETDPRPAMELPVWSFGSGGYRWDLYRPDRVFALSYGRYKAESGDSWHQVDLESNETVAEFDFGDWEPRFVAGEDLWLTRDVDGGQELGRVALS